MNVSRLGQAGLLFSASVAAVLATPAAAQNDAPWYQPLIELYESTDGDNWFRNENWLEEDVSPCEWYGVICEGPSGTMSALVLPDNNLNGTLPVSLLNGVDSMTRLDLSFNRLRGQLPNPARPGSLGPGGIPVVGPTRIDDLDLSFNRLEGPLPDDLLSMGLNRLLLRDNRLSGELPEAWGDDSEALERMDLSDNQLEGSVPESWAEMEQLEFLNFSGNPLSGDLSVLFGLPVLSDLMLDRMPGLQLPESLETTPAPLFLLSLNGSELSALPDWIDELSLGYLDVSGNLLSGSIDPIVDAFGPTVSLLDVSHNQLTGVLPDALFDKTVFDAVLCWNDFEMPGPARVDQINDWQDGLEFEQCNMPAPTAGPEDSGVWYRPEYDGEGYSLMQLESGDWILYSFEPGSDEGGQVWTLEQTSGGDTPIEFRGAIVTGDGSFNDGVDGSVNIFELPWFHNRHRLTPVSANRLAFDSSVATTCLKCRFPEAWGRDVETVRDSYERLTQLAGSTCSNGHPQESLSGIWYRPEVGAAGLVLQVTPDGRGVLYWATYLPEAREDSGQAWVVGVGEFDGNQLLIDEVLRPVLDSSGELTLEQWGDLTLTFDNDESAQLQWSSSHPDFPDGSHSVERLAKARLADCD